MVEGAKEHVLKGLDDGFAMVVAEEYKKLQSNPYPETKVETFLMAVTAAAKGWNICKDAIEQEMADG